ncbi:MULTISPECIES: DUF4214 domain-containing protein [unclassified Pseudomonas]|uniref:DUF4214 domain-containing protein n=1 Tax=unclassified Pseudomonas TaxID=196821 RepID=UPI0025F0940C|nr:MULTISPECIES: DUF4214 domain-containing protein [unclassified Pseudomonas]
MTVVTYSQPVDVYNLNDWYNANTHFSSATSSAFQLTDGYHTLNYTGFAFTYNTNGVSGGVLTGLDWSAGGQPVFSVSGINTSYNTVLDYALAGDEVGMGKLLLQGNDTFIGSYGNDDFYGYSGIDTYDGNGGIDTVWYDTGKDTAMITATASGYRIITPGKIDTLTNIERVEFGDGSSLALDVQAGQNAGSAYRLYQAAFDRKPDTAGLKYWIAEMDKGQSVGQIAQSFVNSDEFKALNPGQDQNSILNNYYLHVLHRTADDAGLQYWNTQMASGMKANEVLVSFSESQENLTNTKAALDGGIWLS